MKIILIIIMIIKITIHITNNKKKWYWNEIYNTHKQKNIIPEKIINNK